MDTTQGIIVFLFLVLLPVTLMAEFHPRGRVNWRGVPVKVRSNRTPPPPADPAEDH